MLAQRILNIPFVQRSDALRSFFTAAWLGWQIESNWADPFLFAIYSIARPVGSVAILVVMYKVITDSAYSDPMFGYIYLGNALYIQVSQIITGVSWVIIDDREHYRVAKQLHTTPVDHFSYLLGRGVARLIIAFVAVVITIIAGVVIFNLPLELGQINFPLLLLSAGLGITCLASMGVVLGSMTMMMARHFWQIGDAVAGAFFLFSGAIFPLDVLPGWLQWIGYVFPVTYYLELSRRALLGDNMITSHTFAEFSNLELIGILGAFTVVLVLISRYVYNWALNRAKDKGLLDLESGY